MSMMGLMHVLSSFEDAYPLLDRVLKLKIDNAVIGTSALSML
jgi:hypothetical protein